MKIHHKNIEFELNLLSSSTSTFIVIFCDFRNTLKMHNRIAYGRTFHTTNIATELFFTMIFSHILTTETCYLKLVRKIPFPTYILLYEDEIGSMLCTGMCKNNSNLLNFFVLFIGLCVNYSFSLFIKYCGALSSMK